MCEELHVVMATIRRENQIEFYRMHQTSKSVCLGEGSLSGYFFLLGSELKMTNERIEIEQPEPVEKRGVRERADLLASRQQHQFGSSAWAGLDRRE